MKNLTTKWTGSKTRLINKLCRQSSIFYSGDMSETAHQLLLDGYIQSTTFGFGNYELTQKGRDKHLSLRL